MVIDQLVEAILQKRNPCIVGIDPEWPKLPLCYRELEISKAEAVLTWAKDVIDAVQDIVPAVKPQMAFLRCLAGRACGCISRWLHTPTKRACW